VIVRFAAHADHSTFSIDRKPRGPDGRWRTEAAIKTLIDHRNAVPEDILLTSRRHTFRRGREHFNVKPAFLFGGGLH
jgi:hypothetical protein